MPGSCQDSNLKETAKQQRTPRDTRVGQLFERGLLGGETPTQLLRTMIFMTDAYFHHISSNSVIYRQQIQVIDVASSGLMSTGGDGLPYVEFTHISKKVSGIPVFDSQQKRRLYANYHQPERCFVRLTTDYLQRAPVLHDIMSPFFLVPKKLPDPCYWYIQVGLSPRSIRRMLRDITSVDSLIQTSHMGLGTGNNGKGMRPISSSPSMGLRESSPQNPVLHSTTSMACVESNRDLSASSSSTNKTNKGSSLNIGSVQGKPEDNTLHVPQIVRKVNDWLALSHHSTNALQVRQILQVGADIDSIVRLQPWQLFFLLRYFIQNTDCFPVGKPREKNVLERPLREILSYYEKISLSSGHVLSDICIQTLMDPQPTSWQPMNKLLSPSDLAEKGVLGSKNPTQLLRSVIFLLAVHFQLGPSKLRIMTRSMVVIDEDTRGRYVCFGADSNCGLLHQAVHNSASSIICHLSAGVGRFETPPLRIYAEEGHPEACLVNLLAIYLARSPVLEMSLFLRPARSWESHPSDTWWYEQQFIGRNRIGSLLSEVMAAANCNDSLPDLIHGLAMGYGEVRTEVCKKCLQSFP